MLSPVLIRGLIAALFLSLSSLVFAEPVNINTASAAELTRLKGIGPAKADAILRYRSEQGTFGSIEELVNVRGIGPALLAKNRDQLTISDNSVATNE